MRWGSQWVSVRQGRERASLCPLFAAEGACTRNVETGGSSCHTFCARIGGTCNVAADEMNGWQCKAATKEVDSAVQGNQLCIPTPCESLDLTCGRTFGDQICSCSGWAEWTFWETIEAHCGCKQDCGCGYDTVMGLLLGIHSEMDLFGQMAVEKAGPIFDSLCSAQGANCNFNSPHCQKVYQDPEIQRVNGLLKSTMQGHNCPAAPTAPSKCPVTFVGWDAVPTTTTVTSITVTSTSTTNSAQNKNINMARNRDKNVLVAELLFWFVLLWFRL